MKIKLENIILIDLINKKKLLVKTINNFKNKIYLNKKLFRIKKI